MPKIMNYSLGQFEVDIELLAEKIKPDLNQFTALFPIPRGGIPVALALSKALDLPLVGTPFDNGDGEGDYSILVVDDLVDSGKTKLKYPNHKFATIHVKTHTPDKYLPDYFVSVELDWIDYWWEANEVPVSDSVVRMLEYIGEDPTREGLIDTPARVIRSWESLFAGYRIDDIRSLLATFNTNHNEMVILKDIEMYSMCEHHMLPFIGKAHIAYIPNEGRIVGISKLARLLEVFSRRLQIQERIGDQVTDALMEFLNPLGAACIIEAQHLCMKMRGVEKQNSVMTTSSLKGTFLSDTNKGRAAREELIRLIR